MSTDNDFKANMPKDFTGERSDLQNFIDNCELMFIANKAKIKSDDGKIAFALSFFTSGTAADWRRNWMKEKNG
ncbi:hypothetical protein DENSPDRAFT_776928, partial [Dentipellis sp. KUC8613]